MTEVHDDLSEMIHCFLNDTIERCNSGRLEGIEIEVKFGLLLDKNTNQRIHLPVHSECSNNSLSKVSLLLSLVVDAEGWTRFVSDMPVSYHRAINGYMNDQFRSNKDWKYSHTKTVDKKFPSGTRLTIDPQTGSTLAAVKKTPLAHLAVHLPRCGVDLRVSVNREDTGVGLRRGEESSSVAVSERRKDRVSYAIEKGHLAVDLTQVTQMEGTGGGAQLKHELEIEVAAGALTEFLSSPKGPGTLVNWCRQLSRLLK